MKQLRQIMTQKLKLHGHRQLNTPAGPMVVIPFTTTYGVLAREANLYGQIAIVIGGFGQTILIQRVSNHTQIHPNM
ncbi:hypothetical protein D3C86_732450 [compost metagenome]